MPIGASGSKPKFEQLCFLAETNGYSVGLRIRPNILGKGERGDVAGEVIGIVIKRSHRSKERPKQHVFTVSLRFGDIEEGAGETIYRMELLLGRKLS